MPNYKPRTDAQRESARQFMKKSNPMRNKVYKIKQLAARRETYVLDRLAEALVASDRLTTLIN